jgi:hypothetical protein
LAESGPLTRNESASLVYFTATASIVSFFWDEAADHCKVAHLKAKMAAARSLREEMLTDFPGVGTMLGRLVWQLSDRTVITTQPGDDEILPRGECC